MRVGGLLAQVAALGVTLSLPSFATADEGRAKETFATVCSACHGPDGGGNAAMLAPSIAGLDEWYIVLQLDKFRAGWRGEHFQDVGGERMAPMARSLADEDAVRSVAAYVASLPPVKPAPTLTGGDPTHGASRFVACVACHGIGGDGNRMMNVPAINHASDWYLFKQIQHFQTGIRGSHPGDRTGMLMRGMSMTLSDEQALRDVIAYISTALTPMRSTTTTP
jgi:cytochrome c oxidase subunit 2